MTIKPIDLQTNIGQMTEVGRHEHARLGSLAAQQQLLDKEAADKSNQINSKLSEAEKGEKTSIRNEERQGDSYHQSSGNTGKDSMHDGKPAKERMHDEKMGHLIDVFK